MQVFAVFGVNPSGRFAENLESTYPGNYFKVDENAFLVAANGETSQEVSDKLGIGAGDSGVAGVVIPVYNFWGFHDRQTWEWLAAHESR